eukprot:UC1_evm1s2186
MPSRTARRELERREAAKRVRMGTGQRAMTTEEMTSLAASVRRGAVGPFGIVRLSALRINDMLLPPPFDVSSWAPHGLTLLHYASIHGADRIVLALLRAGADPTIPIPTQQVDCIPSTAIATATATATVTATATATATDVGKDAGEKSFTTAAAAAATNTVTDSIRGFTAATAGAAAAPAPICATMQTSDAEEEGEPDDIYRDSTPKQRAVVSKSRWMALPGSESAASDGSASAGKSLSRAQRRFKALPLTAAAASGIGYTRAARCEALERAAYVGRTPRLRAILTAGCDVDMQDEYGRTPLFLAALAGHVAAVRTLVQWGADTTAAAHGGWTPLKVAKVHNYTKVIRVLSS